jgi:hypothetical protein
LHRLPASLPVSVGTSGVLHAHAERAKVCWRFYTDRVGDFRSRKQAHTSSRYPLLLFWNRLPLLSATW